MYTEKLGFNQKNAWKFLIRVYSFIQPQKMVTVLAVLHIFLFKKYVLFVSCTHPDIYGIISIIFSGRLTNPASRSQHQQ